MVDTLKIYNQFLFLLIFEQLSDCEPSEYEAQLVSLREKLDDAVMFKTKAETLEKECQEFKQSVAELERKLAEVRNSIEKIKDENGDLQKGNECLNAAVADLQAQLVTMTTTNKRLEQEKRDLVVLNSELEARSVEPCAGQ